MSIYIPFNKKVTNIFTNVNGEKKKIISAWANKDENPTKVWGLNSNFNNGTFYISDGKEHALSKNGKDWEKISSFPTYEFAYGNGKIVSFSGDGKSIYSIDGISWKDGSVVLSPDVLEFVNNKFIGLYVAKHPIVYSDDGINWISTDYSSNGNDTSISYGNNVYTLCEGESVYYSYDLLNWTQALFVNNFKFVSITFGNNKFVAVGQHANNYSNGGIIYYSNNGIDWTKAENTPFLNDLYSIIYGNGRFVAVGNGEYIYYSDDGYNWIEVSGLNDKATYVKVIFGDNLFIVSGNYYPYYSEDAINWNQCNLLASNPINTGKYRTYDRLIYVPNN